jgi:hypothetical protein
MIPKESNKAPELHFPKIPFVVDKLTHSTSGKYRLFLGHHYEAGISCWVVGAISGITGIATVCHFNEKVPEIIAPKAEAHAFWEQFSTKMKEKAHDEEPGYLDDLQPYLDRTN